MLLPHGAIVALVDGEKLELYRNAGDEAEPELAPLAAPRLDSHNHSGAGHHSSAGNHADRQVAEDAHASAVAQWLNEQVLGHKIDRLVVFAAPRTLGELRRHYHKLTAQALLHEFDKDMVGRQPRDVLEAMRARH